MAKSLISQFDPLKGADALRRRLLGKKVTSIQDKERDKRRNRNIKPPPKKGGTTGAEGQMRFRGGVKLDASQVDDRRAEGRMSALYHGRGRHVGDTDPPGFEKEDTWDGPVGLKRGDTRSGGVSQKALARRLVRLGKSR